MSIINKHYASIRRGTILIAKDNAYMTGIHEGQKFLTRGKEYEVLTWEPQYNRIAIVDDEYDKHYFNIGDIHEGTVRYFDIKVITKREKLRKLYLSWVNDFLTTGRFAEYYALRDEEHANRIICIGRELHRKHVQSL